MILWNDSSDSTKAKCMKRLIEICEEFTKLYKWLNDKLRTYKVKWDNNFILYWMTTHQILHCYFYDLIEFPVRKNGRRDQGPNVETDAHPRGGYFDPHWCDILVRQLRIRAVKEIWNVLKIYLKAPLNNTYKFCVPLGSYLLTIVRIDVVASERSNELD